VSDFPHHTFREYDIRGIAGTDITEQLAYQLGQSFAAMLPPDETRSVIVGRDVRLTGKALQTALIQGLNDAGMNVLDIGIVPTPMSYYAVHELKTAGSIHVTASHNPSQYNGFKMMIGTSSLHGDSIQRLKEIMQQQHQPASLRGSCKSLSITEHYSQFIINDCPLSRPFKVVIDAGNGPSGMIAAPLYRQLGCEVIELYCEPDGRFPNHHPDPTIAENLTDLIHTVRSHHADLGIAFDGDGDRIGIVDEQGNIIWSDMLLLLLSRQLLATHPGATIISEIKSSQMLYNAIEQAGGKAVMWRTGHSLIKAKMKETGALLAGEMSGHLFFADRFFGFDDATYAGARIMQLLADSGKSFRALLADVPPTVCTPELRIPCSDADKFNIVHQAIAHFKDLGYDIIDIDGMRIRFEDGWGLLRASNTQPALVMRFEAPNQQRLDDMRALIESWLQQNHT